MASTALALEVLLDEIVEIGRELDQIESEVSRQQVQIVWHADQIILRSDLNTFITLQLRQVV